jgi:CheY-like chemotaxis protein
MPVLDGWRFLEEGRRDAPGPGVPLLVTTSTILTREWAEAHDCAGFLRKPAETEELLGEVRRCLG